MAVVRLTLFTVFLILGAAVALGKQNAHRRFVEQLFILYCALTMVVAGLLNHDLWPFSSYPMIPESSSRYREAVWYELCAVDASGQESRSESQAWSPLTPSVMQKWTERTFIGRLRNDERQRAARFLLSRLNARECRNDSLLGPLAAPDWLRSSAGKPVRAVTLRIYRHDFEHRTLAYESDR